MYIEYIDTHSKFSEAERVIDIQKGNRYKWCGRNPSRPPTEKEEIRRWYHAVSVFSWPFLTLHELGWPWVLVGLPWFLYQLLSRGWFRNRSIPHISTPPHENKCKHMIFHGISSRVLVTPGLCPPVEQFRLERTVTCVAHMRMLW